MRVHLVTASPNGSSSSTPNNQINQAVQIRGDTALSAAPAGTNMNNFMSDAFPPRSEPEPTSLKTVMDWYIEQCDGDWEHGEGISISTLDNPGWIMKARLVGTDLEGVQMAPIFEGCDPDMPVWIDCRIRDGRFVGACDPTQLPRVIDTFAALIHSRLR